jgi:hypothetical protein
MATRYVAKAAKKGRPKNEDIAQEPGVALPAVALVCGHAPPNTATSVIGNDNASKALLCKAPAMAKQAFFSYIDGNLLPTTDAIFLGMKRKAIAPHPRKSTLSSTAVAFLPVPRSGEQAKAEQVWREVTTTTPRRIKITKQWVLKLVKGMILKRGCQSMLVTKQVYVDTSLYEF